MPRALIIDRVDSVEFLGGNQRRQVRRVHFQVEGYPPDFIIMPLDSWSEKAETEAIKRWLLGPTIAPLKEINL